MRLTHHAAARWRQRFPHLDPEKEWSRSFEPKRNSLAKILALSGWHRHATECGLISYRVTSKRVVFVVAEGETVVTVFRLPRDVGVSFRSQRRRAWRKAIDARV